MALRKQTRAQKLPRAGFIARNRFWGAHELNYLILHQSWTDLKWWVDGRLFHQLHTHTKLFSALCGHGICLVQLDREAMIPGV
jgi:hypothetical protein